MEPVEEGDPSGTPDLWDILDAIWSDVPDEDLQKMPTDLAAEHDHYIYGTPKKYEGVEHG